MKAKLKSLFFALFIIGSTVSGAYAQISPNGKIKVEENNGNLIVRFDKGLSKYNRNGRGWQDVVTIQAGVTAPGTLSKKKAKVEYDMVCGKKLHCTNMYNEMIYPLTGGFCLTVRAYNDGIAWCGSLTDGGGDIVDFSTATNSWLMRWTDSYEEFFTKNRPRREGQRLAYPALFEYENGLFALLSESDISRSNAASSFYFTDKDGVFDIRQDGREESGWQTLIIGKLSDIVESTLITDNSQPCRLEDTSWIKPGVASWIYWANNHGSNDFSIIKKYVDLAVQLDLPYVLIDAEWDGMDKLASNNGKTIEDAIKYAVDRNISPLIWYSSSIGWLDGAPGPKFRLNTPEDREKEFAWCEKLGIKGVKIDFFSGDTNQNIQFMIDILECAAKHHLTVNFHGATTMRGWQRTYPNLVSTEAVYGAEWYNNTPMFTKRAAAHNATLPFTRNVLGSMDYTPCAFTDSQHPHITTHAHELALTALFESGIQHLADRPESFLAQPKEVRDYLSTLPTAWDETHYVAGYPGIGAVLARRSGDTWYIAGINGLDEIQTFDISALSKLKIKCRNSIIFSDTGNAENPWLIRQAKGIVSIPQEMVCLPRGGFLIVLRP